MPGLSEFLRGVDIGVSTTGDDVHIVVSLLEHLHAVIDALDVVTPTIAAGEATTVGVATVAGVGLAFTGPILGMTGVFMALGSGYEEARQEIENEAVCSGFSQGLVAGFLKMSGKTVSYLFAKHGVVHVNDFDPDADALQTASYNRGLVAGYTLAQYASDDQKTAFILELRQFTGNVPVGSWEDRDKINYVIEYAAKLRLNYLQ